MSLLAVRFCKQLRYHLRNEINSTIIRRYNGAMFHEQPEEPIKSKLFPDYNVVYVYPYAHIAYLCNKIKRNYTALAIATIPVATTLQMLDYMYLSTCIGITSLVCLVALPLHTLCVYWNYTVGSIYFKEGESNVIISYVNYWGKRINLTVDMNNILPFSEVPYNTAESKYLRMKIASVKPTLKLHTKNAHIYEPPVFYNIFGDMK